MFLKLFCDIDLRQSLDISKEKIRQAIDKYSNQEILANDFEILTENLFWEFYIQPIKIFDEEFSKRSLIQGKIAKRVDPYFRDIYRNEYVDVDGVTMRFYFPYEGERDLFRCRASTYSLSGYPDVDIDNSYVIIEYEYGLSEVDSPEKTNTVFKRLERDIDLIRKGADYANADVVCFNDAIKDLALQYLQEKKKKVESFYSIASMFEVPVKKTEYATNHVPLKRRTLPIAHTYDKQDIYCISDSDYIDILSTIKHTGSTYERTPASYKHLHEEDLRNTLLAALNATYLGQATGEAFRNHGKTDICIEYNNRAAFVAECKMWTGPREVSSALSQLDSYLTWRDCKTALIYFVKRKDFFAILKSAEKAIKENKNIRQFQSIDKNEFKCAMVSEANPGQIIQVRVLLFNLYSEK